jgi:1-acyl-sn-glycerol-3-phosphate acyltransferase
MNTQSTTVPVRPDLLRPLRYLWRVPLVFLMIVLAIVFCLLIASGRRNEVMRDGKEPFSHLLIRWWSRNVLRVFGLRSVRIGQPLADPVLFVANHTSWLDIVLLHSQRAACFVAKAEIASWPLIGWMASNGGTIFHRRGSNHSLSTVMQTMVEQLREGRSVGVFPEGGTGYNGVLKVFHARIFQAALDAEVSVQPVALRFARDGRRVIDAGFRENESFLANLLRLLGGPPLDAEVHFLAPVPASPDARRRMAELSRERIAAALQDRTA